MKPGLRPRSAASAGTQAGTSLLPRGRPGPQPMRQRLYAYPCAARGVVSSTHCHSCVVRRRNRLQRRKLQFQVTAQPARIFIKRGCRGVAQPHMCRVKHSQPLACDEVHRWLSQCLSEPPCMRERRPGRRDLARGSPDCGQLSFTAASRCAACATAFVRKSTPLEATHSPYSLYCHSRNECECSACLRGMI
jgi:hypothetical protein